MTITFSIVKYSYTVMLSMNERTDENWEEIQLEHE